MYTFKEERDVGENYPDDVTGVILGSVWTY